MTLIEFLSLGLIPGKKYTVILKEKWAEEPVEQELYFKGFRFFYGRKTGDETQIIPIFNETTKSGRMSPKHYNGIATWVEHIIDVKGTSPTQTYLYDDLLGLDRAISRIGLNVKRQTINLLQEMNELFPGKKITIDPDCACPATHYFKHGAQSVTITGAGIDANGIPVFDIQGEFDNEKDIPAEMIEPDSWPYLEKCILDSIGSPFHDEDTETFIDEDATWKAIPLEKIKKSSILEKTGILLSLAADLWMRDLPFKKKIGLISMMNHKFDPEKFIAENDEDLQEDLLICEWNNYDAKVRTMLFQNETRSKN